MGKAIIVSDINFASANLGQVTLSGSVPVQGIRISAPDTFTGLQMTPNIIFAPLNTTQRGVTWSIASGSEYATINADTGVLTVLSGASANNVTIKVASTDAIGIEATKTISVTYEGGLTLYDYIKTDGNSYFSIGKLGRNDKLTIIGKTLSFTTLPEKSNAVFGVAKNANGDFWIYDLMWRSYLIYESSLKNIATISLGNTDHRYTYEREIQPNAEFTHTIDISTGAIQYGTLTGMATVADDAFVNNETPFDCFVFAANKGGTAISFMGVNIYALKELKIERGGAVIHDFKPASSGTLKGVYDTVTGTFKPNLGTGEFTLE